MTEAVNQSNDNQWDWQCQPEADALVRGLVDVFLARCPAANELARRMLDETSTRFVDWIDFIAAPASQVPADRLTSTGYTHRPEPGAPTRHIHEGAMLPAILIEDGPMRVGIKVDAVADFLAMWQVTPDTPILGEPWGQLRMAAAFKADEAELICVERHGCRDFEPPAYSPALAIAAQQVLETFRRRRRLFHTQEQGVNATLESAKHAVAQLAEHTNESSARNFACDLFFHAERDYWQRRNAAARWQKHRQDRLGLGWANHDHHTYRCSRKRYNQTIAIFETLGFHCRERFYAGQEAGWGAQVLEQSTTGHVIFADVDMSPEEVAYDFAHHPLEAPTELGTVGLWVALHGDSILQAGMHHLECQFDHDRLTADLQASGHKVMDRFTDFDYLRQAFTAGETWPVDERRIEKLLADNLITREQANRFRANGAIGSHLENLERNQGYKGFNQHGVSDIIRRTDARTLLNA